MNIYVTLSCDGVHCSPLAISTVLLCSMQLTDYALLDSMAQCATTETLLLLEYTVRSAQELH